jgi:hypothetical protein
MTSVLTEVQLRPGFKRFNSPVIQRHTPERQHSLVIWIALIGIFFPPVLVPLGNINFTPGRFVVTLFLVPAFAIFLRGGRGKSPSDFFAATLATWMLGSSILNGGFKPYVGAEAVEFLGAYMVGRVFVFGPSNFEAFVKALRRITVVLIALALLDPLSGRDFTLTMFGVPNHWEERLGWVRAASVFEGAEHYGTFCVAAAAIFFYSERGTRKLFFVGLTFIGCVLALSSGPLMGLGIVTATYSYDRIFRQYPWRWKALTVTVLGFLLTMFIFFDHPLERIILHLTLDPGTGFFRLATWDAALPIIDQSPIIGHGLADFAVSGDAVMFLSSVDCVWLVEALRYGLPAVVLLILTMFTPFLKGRRISAFDSNMNDGRTGISLAVVTMGLIGLTVHFWDATWLFLNLLIGIRVSLAEYKPQQTTRHRLSHLRSSVNRQSIV